MKRLQKRFETGKQKKALKGTDVPAADGDLVGGLGSRPFVAMGAVCEKCRDCPAFEFCGKRILMVGGIDRMEGRYRDLIESHGGTLEHHNGTMKNGTQKLRNSILRADVVLCPVHNNSHAACRHVKKLGKKFRKPVYLLSNFSLNAVSQVINSDSACMRQLN